MSMRLTLPYPISLDYVDGGEVSAFTGTLGDRNVFYIASNQNDDDEANPAPIRFTITLPERDSVIGWNKDAAMMFRAPGVQSCAHNASWTGAAQWRHQMPDYQIEIDATCETNPSVRVLGVLTGSTG
jgi:hypothetical protein